MKGFARLATVVAISSSLLSLSACQSTPINERPTILEPIQGNGLKKVSAYTKKDLSKIRALLKTTPHNSSIDFAVKDITTGVVMDSFMVNPNSFNPQQQQPIEFSITTNQQMLIVTMPGVKWYEIIYNPSYDPSNQTPVNLTFYWDGRDEDDNFVAPGNYTVRASQMTGLTAGVPYQPFCPTYVIFDETSQSYNPYCSDQGIVRETTVGVVTGIIPTPTPTPSPATSPSPNPSPTASPQFAITIDTAHFKKAGPIVIKGRINPPPPQGFDYGSIQPDFSGDVSPHQVKAKGESNGEFKLEIKEYDFSEDYRSRITDEPLTFPEIKVTLDVCTPNGCGKSNTEIVQEEDSGAYITMGSNKGIKIASLGDNSEDFSTKQVGGNNGQSAAEVFARTYYKATGKLNEPMVLYGGGIYFPKELLKMNAIPRVRLKVWRNGFDYFSSKAYSFIPGTPYRFERTWDGKHNGKLVPEGEYKLRQTIHLANGQERQIAVQKIYIVHKHPGKIRLYALSHISFPYFGNFPLGTPLGGVNMTVHAPDGDPGVTVTTGAILGIADVGIFKKGKHVISVGNAYGSKSVLETVESVNEEPELVAHFAQNQLFRLIRKN